MGKTCLQVRLISSSGASSSASLNTISRRAESGLVAVPLAAALHCRAARKLYREADKTISGL